MSFFGIHAPSVPLSASVLLPLILDPTNKINQQPIVDVKNVNTLNCDIWNNKIDNNL